MKVIFMTTVSGQLVQYEHIAFTGFKDTYDNIRCVVDVPEVGKIVGAVFTKVIDHNNIDRTDRVIGIGINPYWNPDTGHEDDTKVEIYPNFTYNPDDPIQWPLNSAEGYVVIQKPLDFEVNMIAIEIWNTEGERITNIEGTYDVDTNTATFDIPDEYNGYIGRIMATDTPEDIISDTAKYMSIITIGESGDNNDTP
jgi:hypothetical protein